MMVQASEVCFTRTGGQAGPCWQQHLQDHAKFATSQKAHEGALVKKDADSLTQVACQGNGHDTFCPAKACNANVCGRQNKSGWSIFVLAGGRQAVFGRWGQYFKISPVILQFAKKFAAQLRLQPPLSTFNEVKAFCVKRDLIKPDPPSSGTSPRAHSPSEAATERRRRPPGNVVFLPSSLSCVVTFLTVVSHVSDWQVPISSKSATHQQSLTCRLLPKSLAQIHLLLLL